ncbi:MAG: hypothetical protein IPJ32_19310 [Sphingobacteriaceae bacterium]|nr:hypothetical protein [Sphingobacteriaceae bacterium]
MKAIISHDIDHITVTEHLLSDLIVPKFLIRSHLELVLCKISFTEYISRWTDFLKNKWQNIDELITYNNVKQVPSSFFIGVKKGIGLSYSNELAVVWMEQMINRGCEFNLHGINFNSINVIKEEKELFYKLCKQEATGIRMHYVRSDQETLLSLSKAGYKFDTTVHAFENPYKVGDMWEFPFQIMDGWVIENGKKWQSSNLNKAKELTKKQIDKAHKHNLMYLGIDFHDRYFSRSFNTWLEWYMWVVDYLIQNKIEFVNYATAIKELEQVNLHQESKAIKIEH